MNESDMKKMTDSAFSRAIFALITCIIVCIVCLCSTTWAWFSDSIPSGNNEIRAASSCLLRVSVVMDGGDGEELLGTDGSVALEQGVTYWVTLSLPKDSASGYCLITAADGTVYRSDYIARHESETPETLTFTLTVEQTQDVTFTPRWGIYSGECSVINGEIHITP